MGLEKIVAGILITGLLGLGSWLYHSGWLRSPTYEVRSSYPPVRVIYKEHIGPYYDLGPVRLAAVKFLKERGVKCLGTFDQLLTRREDHKESELRAWSGCIVEDYVKNLGSSGWKNTQITNEHDVLIVTYPGRWAGALDKMGKVRMDYLKQNHKRPTTFLLIHRPAFPLWGQPVQIGVYGLEDDTPSGTGSAQIPAKPAKASN